MLLQNFNNCWETASWPWKKSRVIFIRRQKKERSYQLLYISSHFDKHLEQTLASRFNKYLDLPNIIGQAQESLKQKNTVRSLYRLHLSLERARALKISTALHQIKLEKTFDSVWIHGLLYKLRNNSIAGRVIQILDASWRNRHVVIELG